MSLHDEIGGTVRLVDSLPITYLAPILSTISLALLSPLTLAKLHTSLVPLNT